MPKGVPFLVDKELSLVTIHWSLGIKMVRTEMVRLQAIVKL